MRRFAYLMVFLFTSGMVAAQQGTKKKPAREYMELRVYHAADTGQLQTIAHYLQEAFLPALEKKGFNRIGVFTALDNDTARDKRIYVLVPFSSLSQLQKLSPVLNKEAAVSDAARQYVLASHKQPPFTRYETILLQAFAGMPRVKAPALQGSREERVYELRSYESATEALHQNKVDMFNDGEVQLFDRLGFNAVFYGQVIAGSRMPNLMYMTSFDNKAARDKHWKTFGSHPDWKAMSSLPQYQNNVSKIDIVFLRPASFSKL